MDLLKNHYELVPVSLRNNKVTDLDFDGVYAVVHLAGIAHQMKKIDNSVYFKVNHDLSIELAKQAKKFGVKHFIYMSTLKVYGLDCSKRPLLLSSNTEPSDPYGRSKLLAENDLSALTEEGFSVAIIRTPLVYGPEVKGNMLSLIKIIRKLPAIPLGGISNQRSLIYIDNLIGYIERILETGYEGIVLPSDPSDISTTDLVNIIVRELDNTTIIFPLPGFLRSFILRLSPDYYNRLYGSLTLDSSASNSALGYKPAIETEIGIQLTVNWFKSKYS